MNSSANHQTWHIASAKLANKPCNFCGFGITQDSDAQIIFDVNASKLLMSLLLCRAIPLVGYPAWRVPIAHDFLFASLYSFTSTKGYKVILKTICSTIYVAVLQTTPTLQSDCRLCRAKIVHQQSRERLTQAPSSTRGDSQRRRPEF